MENSRKVNRIRIIYYIATIHTAAQRSSAERQVHVIQNHIFLCIPYSLYFLQGINRPNGCVGWRTTRSIRQLQKINNGTPDVLNNINAVPFERERFRFMERHWRTGGERFSWVCSRRLGDDGVSIPRGPSRLPGRRGGRGAEHPCRLFWA
jgi:hypothetical protein